MEKFVPYEKLSKKKQWEINAARRGSWGALSPVTRRSENPKANNRNKARKGCGGIPDVPLFFACGRGDVKWPHPHLRGRRLHDTI